MKRNFTKFWSDSKTFIKNQYQASPHVFHALLAIIVLLVVSFVATSLIRSMANYGGSDEKVALMPTMLATTTADSMRQPLATPTLLPTAVPTPSNLWVVNKLLDPVNGVLVVEFKNASTGELRNGQCQSPNDPDPKIGDHFISEDKGGYILLSPVVPGTSLVDLDSKVQRFIFIP